MSYAGFYINLDRSPDRRAEIENEIEHHGLSAVYKRFRALDGNELQFPMGRLKEGEIGCFSSHYSLLKANVSEDRHLHIIEDDVILSTSTAQVINWAIDQGLLAQYDILYTDITVPLLNDAYKAYKKFYDTTVDHGADGSITKIAFGVINLRELMFASTSSFVVNKDSIGKIHKLYGEELFSGAVSPIDLFIRKKCQEGLLRVGCLMPFVTSIRLEHTLGTSIEMRHNAVSVLASNIARHSFFIGCDWQKCQAYITQYLTLPVPESAHTKILNHLLAFSLTDAYQSF